MIKKFYLTVSMLLVACGIMAGCAKKTESSNPAFANAAPEIKAIWDQAVAADKTNDYVAASTGYRSLIAQKDKLSGEQIEAIQDASLAMNQRLTAAANSGDAAAKAAAAKLAGMQMR
jgi:hypothetical protein